MVSRNSVAQSNTGIGNVMPNTELVQMEMPCMEQCFPFPFASLSAASHSNHIEMRIISGGRHYSSRWIPAKGQTPATIRLFMPIRTTGAWYALRRWSSFSISMAH
jgi:hypothetical protein